MKMNRIFLGLIASIVVVSGCSTPPQRIQAGGPTAVTTMGIDLMDFKDAAGQVVQALLVHPLIANFPAQHGGRTPTLNVGAIYNKTGTQFDMAQVAGRINEDLLNSGLVQLIANDAGSVEANAEDAFMNDVKVNRANAADFYLEGTISALTARESRLRERTYTFQLRVNDRNRRTVFQKTVDIAKQGTRGGAIGW